MNLRPADLVAEIEIEIRTTMERKAKSLERTGKSRNLTLAQKVAAQRIAKLIRDELSRPTLGPDKKYQKNLISVT